MKSGVASDEDRLERVERLLAATLAVLIADRDERASGRQRKSEQILSGAGLTLSEVASLTGRDYEAVKSTLRRVRKESPSG